MSGVLALVFGTLLGIEAPGIETKFGKILEPEKTGDGAKEVFIEGVDDLVFKKVSC